MWSGLFLQVVFTLALLIVYNVEVNTLREEYSYGIL